MAFQCRQFVFFAYLFALTALSFTVVRDAHGQPADKSKANIAAREKYRISIGGSLRTLAVSAKGDLLALAELDGVIAVHELSTGKKKCEFACVTKNIPHLEFISGGRQLAASIGTTIKVWDMANGREISDMPRGCG
jgi:hypothetical protein